MKTLRSIFSQELRVSFLRMELSSLEPEVAVAILDYVFVRARGAKREAREALVTLTSMLGDRQAAGLATALRSQLSAQSDAGLVRLLGHPESGTCAELTEEERDRMSRVPEYGKGRVLTLGERKALARMPSRKQFDKLLLDPHPAVIRNLLANPRTTEEDVIRLVARRPLHPDLLREVAAHPQWRVRRRVRMAILLNPHCPTEVGLPLVGLLLRSELRTAADGPGTNPAVRQAALERLREMRARRS
jgi:hypothetical protein